MAELGEGLSGYLDVQDATLRAPRLEAVSNIGIANTAPQHAFSVGSNLYVDTESSNVLTVKGNVVTEGIKMGFIEITPSYDFAAVSNVGNVTANVIQFANATTGFTTTANVEIGGNITLTANAQVKVGSNVLAEYTGPHPRDPKEVPLKKYPEIVFDASKLDGNDTTNTYTQAGYTVTASGNSTGPTEGHPWNAFDNLITDFYDAWQTAPSRYSSSTRLHTAGVSTTVSSTVYLGDYIQLQFPNKITVDRVDILPMVTYGVSRMPGVGIFAGSDNGTTWTLLKSVTNNTHTLGLYSQFYVNATQAYKYIRIIWNELTTAGPASYRDRAAAQHIKIYGTEEPAPPGDLSLDTTLKSTFNSVRSNNYVMYFDGEDPAAGNVPKYLVSGSAKSITPNNVVFDATNNCWTLDGSTESNVTTGSLGLVGDAPHTVSTWINASNLEANASTQQLFSIGSGYDKALIRVDDTQIAANTWHNVTYAYQGEGGSKVTYVDGRKVEEAQVEDTFGAYPPFAMTDYETGGYRVSASNHTSVFYPWTAFDGLRGDVGEGWFTDGGLYTIGGDGAATSSATEFPVGTGRRGEYLDLEMPHKLKVSYFVIQTRDTSHTKIPEDSPHEGYLYGSNDGINWTVIKFFSGLTYGGAGVNSAAEESVTVNSTTAYKHLRLQATKRGGSNGADSYVGIGELKYYGHKEGDLTRFPEPTRVLEYPHIAVGVPRDTPAKRGYVVTTGTSIFSGRTGARAFDDQPTGDGWETDNGSFSDQVNQTGGDTFTNLGSGGGSFTGHWIQLEMPHKLKFTGHIEINAYVNGTTDDRRPDAGAFLGSNDGSNWYLLHEFTSGSLNWVSLGGTTNQAKITTLSASNTNAYKYVVMVITKKSDVGTSTLTKTSIRRLRYYGTEEDTGTPAIVGGPFAGKVANFRVYDQYLGDERIQEIYDAQKDTFGHKKSSMTLYKGRIGVGTTEPEGALTVLDEPHALAKFPARAVSADDSYVEGDGQIKLSAADGSGYQAFDGLTSTSWTATPTRNTRLSEEVDFGAWLKIQTPESVSLKKAEIESNPDWQQLGTRIDGVQANARFGDSVALSDDGTRLVAGAWNQVGTNNSGAVYVYDWNGSAWTRVGSVIGHHTDSGSRNGWDVSISGDGNTVAVGSRVASPGANSGSVTSFTLVGATWTLKGAVIATGLTGDFTGYALSRMSTDGNIVAFSDYLYDKQSSETDLGGVSGNTHNDAGRVRVFKYENGSWSQRGSSLIGENASDGIGLAVQMSEDGKYLIFSTTAAGKVYVFEWNGTTYVQRGSTLTGVAGDQFGQSVDISKDGSMVAVGYRAADVAEGALAGDNGLVKMYKWNGTNAYTLINTLTHIDALAGAAFGSVVRLSSDGTRLIVGADSDDAGGSSSGIVYTFEYDGSSWLRRDPYASIGTTAPASYLIGRGRSAYVSRDGSTIGIGEYGSSTGGAYSGSVRVFSMPSNIKSIWGSNDDVNWTKITTGNETFRVDDRLEFKNLDNPNYYKYHAIVADAFTRLKDIKLYGIRNQGSSTLNDGTLTLTKKVTAPQLESTGIINMKGDYTEIRANSNVVTEFNRSKKFMKFPRVALGTNASPYSGVGSGSTVSGYTIRASGEYSNDPSFYASRAFSSYPDTWITNNTAYTGATGLPVANSANVTKFGQEGSWLEIKLPNTIQLNSTRIFSRPGAPHTERNDTADIWASNTGTDGDWVKLTTINFNDTYTDVIPMVADIDTQAYYRYFAIQITKIGWTGGTYGNIGEWELYGVPEYDPEAHGVDVVVKSVPNVPNTDWLEVYYDAKNYSGAGDVQDETTNNRDAEMNATFDNGEIKAFNFSGALTSNVTTSDHGLGTGDVVYTMSYWFKRTAVAGSYDYVVMLGNGGTAYSSSLMWINNNQLTLDHWGSALRVLEPIVLDKWYHVVAGHRGGVTPSLTNDFIYIDGIKVTPEITQTSAAFTLAGSKLTLGTSHLSASEYFNGSIANFRLFNRALTSDEVWQLYAYQKEYFGHGDLGMTLKAGRLGIGTSEPQAALDVRGDTILGSRVGIGTTNPSYKLNILTDTNYDGISLRDSTRELMKIAKGNDGAYINMFESGVSKVNISTGGDSYFTGGNVGIGITNPPAKLYVKTTGSASMGGSWNTTDFVVSHGVGTTAPSQSLGVAIGVDGTGDAGTSKGYLWCMRPNLSWNTLRIQSNVIEMVGLSLVTSNRAITITSDDRLKTEEEFLQNALPTIMKLKPQTYRKHPFLPNDPSKEVTENMTEMSSDLSQLETGLIVQDIWYDAPELRHLVKLGDNANPPEVRPVDPDPSDPTQDPDYSSWGTTPANLEYQGVFVVALRAIQELNTELQTERAKVATLETQLASVLTRLDALEGA